jgi:hypothetical protein
LDRLGRSLKHLIFLMEELQALGVGLVSLGESIDTATPAGRLQIHVLSAVAQFERDRLRERVMAGLQRVKAQGKRLGRPKEDPLREGEGRGAAPAPRSCCGARCLNHAAVALRLSENLRQRGLTFAPDLLAVKIPSVAAINHSFCATQPEI